MKIGMQKKGLNKEPKSFEMCLLLLTDSFSAFEVKDTVNTLSLNGGREAIFLSGGRHFINRGLGTNFEAILEPFDLGSRFADGTTANVKSNVAFCFHDRRLQRGDDAWGLEDL